MVAPHLLNSYYDHYNLMVMGSALHNSCCGSDLGYLIRPCPVLADIKMYI